MHIQAAALPVDAAAELHVAYMDRSEADEVGRLFARVLESLPYYNEQAKAGELAKYRPSGLIDLVSSEPEAVLVARVGPRLAGFCISHEDDQLVWLSWIGADPEIRRMGVASALLHALEERARQLRSHKIWCDSRTTNEPSKAMLTREGYRQICTLRNHWYGQDFILWEKPVA